jgi:hypothetical protein
MPGMSSACSPLLSHLVVVVATIGGATALALTGHVEGNVALGAIVAAGGLGSAGTLAAVRSSKPAPPPGG